MVNSIYREFAAFALIMTTLCILCCKGSRTWHKSKVGSGNLKFGASTTSVHSQSMDNINNNLSEPSIGSSNAESHGKSMNNAEEIMRDIITSNPILKSTLLVDASSSGAGGYGGLGASALYSFSSSADDKDEPNVFFHKICSLCNLKFPKHAIDVFVLYKHIIRLRYN